MSFLLTICCKHIQMYFWLTKFTFDFRSFPYVWILLFPSSLLLSPPDHQPERRRLSTFLVSSCLKGIIPDTVAGSGGVFGRFVNEVQ